MLSSVSEGLGEMFEGDVHNKSADHVIGAPRDCVMRAQTRGARTEGNFIIMSSINFHTYYKIKMFMLSLKLLC